MLPYENLLLPTSTRFSNAINTSSLRLALLIADSSTALTEPLDWATPGVQKVGPNVLNENRTINNSRTDVTIHEGVEELLEALFGDQTKVGKTLYQKIVEEGVYYWSFMVDNTKSCDLLLRMRVERQDEEGVVVGVESVEEEGESRDEGRKKEWGHR